MDENGNLEIYNKFRSVPDNAKKPIQGGRLKGKTDINPMWRIKSLTEQFGPIGIGWYYQVVGKSTHESGGEVAAFVDIELYIKNGAAWSMPICGTGGSMLAEKEKSGIHVSDECYKMATTDALSVACKQLGIGADVYWDADSTKYGKEPAPPARKALTKEQINRLYNELARTGVGRKNLRMKYKIDDLLDLTKEQYEEAITILSQKPDKPIPVIPDDPELPWNQED